MPTTPRCRCWPRARRRTGRLWTYVRDDRPFGGPDRRRRRSSTRPTAAAQHPERHLASYAGLMQADAYAGFNRLYEAGRKPGPIVEAACWAHARRKFFELAGCGRRRSRSRRCSASMRCSPSSARSTGCRRPSASRCARSAAGRWSTRSRPGCASSARKLSSNERDRQGDRLQPQALGGAHPLPRRRPPVHVQQRRRAGPALHRRRPPQLDLRRLRRGRFMLLTSSCD